MEEGPTGEHTQDPDVHLISQSPPTKPPPASSLASRRETTLELAALGIRSSDPPTIVTAARCRAAAAGGASAVLAVQGLWIVTHALHLFPRDLLPLVFVRLHHCLLCAWLCVANGAPVRARRLSIAASGFMALALGESLAAAIAWSSTLAGASREEPWMGALRGVTGAILAASSLARVVLRTRPAGLGGAPPAAGAHGTLQPLARALTLSQDTSLGFGVAGAAVDHILDKILSVGPDQEVVACIGSFGEESAAPSSGRALAGSHRGVDLEVGGPQNRGGHAELLEHLQIAVSRGAAVRLLVDRSLQHAASGQSAVHVLPWASGGAAGAAQLGSRGAQLHHERAACSSHGFGAAGLYDDNAAGQAALLELISEGCAVRFDSVRYDESFVVVGAEAAVAFRSSWSAATDGAFGDSTAVAGGPGLCLWSVDPAVAQFLAGEFDRRWGTVASEVARRRATSFDRRRPVRGANAAAPSRGVGSRGRRNGDGAASAGTTLNAGSGLHAHSTDAAGGLMEQSRG